MTTCDIGNLCWIADKTDICPCSAVLPLILIIAGTILVLTVMTYIVSKLTPSKSKENKDGN